MQSSSAYEVESCSLQTRIKQNIYQAHLYTLKRCTERELDFGLPRACVAFACFRTDSELLTRMRIEHAKKSDSGEFSCTIGQFSTTVVNIHVLNGK